MTKEKLFKTKNIYLATYLFTKKLEFVGTEGEKEKTFIFNESTKREKLYSQFHSRRDCMVDAWEFITAFKLLKSQIYN